MNWRDVWRDHVQKTGDFWVDRTHDRYQVVDENERSYIMRKKRLLRDREAQIVKATVNGRVVGHHRTGNEDHINYRQHLAFLIKHGNHFYIEEQDTEKKCVFEGETLKNDRTLEREMDALDPPRASHLKDRSTSKREPFNYDREAAVKYAEQWWNSYNSEYPTFDVDCTNYVSQCLHAGGAPMTHVGDRTKGWWCKGKTCSYSWSVANALRWYLSSEGNALNAVAVDRPDQLVPGDVICYDWEGNGKWNHNVIVTGKDWEDMPLVNAHTTNSRNRYWSYEDSPAYSENTLYLFFHIGAES